MKEIWLEKKECTGCGACSNICPRNAIEIKPDDCGFIYPVINDSCVGCNACQTVCERRTNVDKERFDSPTTYAVWSKNDKIRFNSTSGGAFTELSRNVLEHGGFVVGAQYRDDNMVEHVVISDEEGLARIRQSKYIQSNMGDIYKVVKEKLNAGKIVAFCGAPCQVAALYAFLGGKKYSNLVTFDFICRGMNSPKAYKAWLNEIEHIQRSKVSRVWFKYKVGGWKKSPRCTRLDFEDGRHIVLDQDDNLFMTGYLGVNLYIRPSCGDCAFKGVPRQGDITLADFWGLDKALDDDKGTSLLLINSENGRKLFEQAKEKMVIHERKFSEILAGNVCFDSSVKVPKNGEEFLKALDNRNFSKMIKKYTKVSCIKRVRRYAKRKIKALIAIFAGQ